MKKFTSVSNQGNSVIDYFIVSVDLISKLSMNFVVGDRVESSHMPLQLNINSHPNTKGKTSRNEKKKRKHNNSEMESWKDGRFPRSYTLRRVPKRNAKSFSIFGFLHWFSSEEIHWNSTSSGRKYEAYDLVRHGPRARYEKVVRPRLPPKEAWSTPRTESSSENRTWCR